jgi:hypothetical protein
MRYDRFLPWVTPYALNCPDPLAINAVRDACIEFCDTTGWITYETDPQSILEDVSDYSFDLPEDTTLARILELYVDDVEMTPKSTDDLRAMYGTNWRTQTGSPHYYTQLNTDEVVLVPQPTATVVDDLKMTVVLKPTRTSTTVDDSVFEWWAETIAAGALMRLLSTAGQPWSNPTDAAARERTFRLGMSEAKRRRQASLTRGPLQVQMRRFF